MYELDGVPREYYQYCFLLHDESAYALSQKILEIHNLDFNLRNKIGTNARRFVLSNKNPQTQALKLFNMIKVATNETTSN